MSKDELKETLGKFSLKEKFKYQINRSSKTHFVASCRDIACNLNYMRVQCKGVNYWRVKKIVKGHNYDMEMFRNCPRQVPKKVIGSIIVFKLQYKGRIIQLNDVVREMQMDHGIRVSYTIKLEEQKNMLKIWYTLIRCIRSKCYHPIAIYLREKIQEQ